MFLGETDDTPSVHDGINVDRLVDLLDESDAGRSNTDAYKEEEEEGNTDTQKLAKSSEQEEPGQPDHLQAPPDKQEQSEDPEAQSNEESVTAAASRTCEHEKYKYCETNEREW